MMVVAKISPPQARTFTNIFFTSIILLKAYNQSWSTYYGAKRGMLTNRFLQSASIKQTLVVLIIYQHSVQLLVRREY
jgi:hypothetical protein